MKHSFAQLRSIVVFLLAGVIWLYAQHCRGGTYYYNPAETTNSSIPTWNPTNSIPLAPDKAVIAAIDYASAKWPKVLSWDVDGVEIRKLSPDSPWFYSITLTDRKSGGYETEVIRVLMNGKVWKPKK